MLWHSKKQNAPFSRSCGATENDAPKLRVLYFCCILRCAFAREVLRPIFNIPDWNALHENEGLQAKFPLKKCKMKEHLRGFNGGYQKNETFPARFLQNAQKERKIFSMLDEANFLISS